MATKLFTSYTLKDVTLKNRIVMSPMCMYSSHEKDGKVQNFHKTHYTSRAIGGAGLLIVEATAVTPQGRISDRDLGIWDDEHIAGLRELVSLMKEEDTKTGIQLAHAGRKAVVDGDILAPSPIAFDETYKQPKEMSVEDIKETVEAFRQGAIRAKQAGFDIIELHGAHGYLLNEFLSPITNKRTDEYGGSAENRYRFLKETITAVKEVWEGPLFVRISANDYLEGGMDPEQYIELTRWMKQDGVDLIDVSSGAVAPARIKAFPGYQVPFSDTIKHGADIPTGAVGLILSPAQADEIIQNDRADLILLGRELLRDPYWPRTAAKELNYEITAPKQYERGW
ncbi:NADPH dehydrogenase NamA [Peribacillus psychrosaccharolyticus]|uniref:NADPH dehydrogenase n=1 Tax=Peribacillus psychrosaccharolyticus TaxID=1407 RepID=A0A974S030_PERPY|nr:NADPH dehydrogenase NamA [Peribacillus psychrosaccharolyticus]MEC2056821.1 NADPH dehydrogenase NamA [Peribacillus psychrosaccharolyticus]MED3746275.1 NADPH dehydrogenase NamA [Peribacillus psychrosaccharolyticus]QQT00056.1 NADPH dehydrogenase NamA [Peribacillus psychrosaccharolyticus]